MNNDRRKELRRALREVEDIKSEMDVLDADEQTGEAGGTDLRDNRVAGWQSRIEDAHSILEDCIGEEEDAQENVRSEDMKDAMGEAIENMGYARDSLEELFALEDKSDFNALFHSKYDDIVNYITDATA